ncbi:hypothetical protein SRHO_G00317820 [Serrasalmus rhombeus]
MASQQLERGWAAGEEKRKGMVGRAVVAKHTGGSVFISELSQRGNQCSLTGKADLLLVRAPCSCSGPLTTNVTSRSCLALRYLPSNPDIDMPHHATLHAPVTDTVASPYHSEGK